MIALRNSELFDTVATLSGGDPYILRNVSVHGKRLRPAPFSRPLFTRQYAFIKGIGDK